jgi:tetratricopeptide (TPR) repeat protein
LNIIERIKLLAILLMLIGAPNFLVAQSRAPQKNKTDVSAQKRTEDEDKSDQAVLVFESAQDAHQKNELEKAVSLYQKALELDMRLWQAEYQMSSALLALNRASEAERSIANVIGALSKAENASELKLYLGKAYVLSAEIAFRNGGFEKAEEQYKQALVINAKDHLALVGLARTAIQKKDFVGAQRYAREAVDSGDTSLTTLAILGEALLVGGYASDAIVFFTSALSQDAKQVSLLRARAKAYLAVKNYAKAIEDLKICLQLESTVDDKLFLAEAYGQLKSYDEAIQLYQQVLKDAPENVTAQTALAVLLIESGKGKEAISSLENLAKQFPDRADLHAQLGALYLASSPDKAREEYLTAVKLNSSNPNYQLGVGVSLVKLKRYAEAVATLRKLLEQKPEGEIAYVTHTNLATALFELEDFANAANAFIWILNQQRDRQKAAVTLYFLGICFDKLGDLEQAQKVYNQFLSIASAENQLEIDKVKLRLPSLQRQLEKGQGKRKK